MKKSIHTVVAAAFGALLLVSAPAMAEICGEPGTPACEIPEPGSLPLTILGIGIAILVARRFKK